MDEIEAVLEELTALSHKLGGQAEAFGPELERSLTKFHATKEECLNKLNEYRLKISSRTERLGLLRERLTIATRELDQIGLKIKQRSGEFDFNGHTREQAKLKADLGELEEVIKALKEKMGSYSSREEAKRHKMFVLQQQLQDAQNEINQIGNQLNDLKINSTRYETRLEDLEIEIRQEMGSLKEVREVREADPVDTEDAKGKIANLKHQLDLIGGIDPQTEKEYEETKERYDFLTTQTKDFREAVDSLQKIIKELDLNIKERFDHEFSIISKKFEEYFKILFNGGSAKIIKVMEEELKEAEPAATEIAAAEGAAIEAAPVKEEQEPPELRRIKYLQKFNATGLAGIEIQATPPGKKIKSIAMLSGGERALTAIAMICAIISSNPSPFVVLDEVDASLDEANSERLAKILDELSHKTQFIVITHNRASMRKANVLYGITMGDDGISKLLSVKLDEVRVD
jgi:chromosome segregation protein